MLKARKKTDLNQTDTLIGQETSMEGQLRSKASTRIDGRIKGDIECEGDCIVGERGHAESNVRARHISIAGKVIGDVFTEGTLTILSTGSLHGNCEAATLIIEEGGVFNGTSSMSKNESQSDATTDNKQHKTKKVDAHLEEAKAAN